MCPEEKDIYGTQSVCNRKTQPGLEGTGKASLRKRHFKFKLNECTIRSGQGDFWVESPVNGKRRKKKRVQGRNLKKEVWLEEKAGEIWCERRLEKLPEERLLSSS